ncbi:MAG: protein kinase [Deltaproteobacteria bacterium]|nr:protein kinase [Deltaproteobacteria bacterium]
MDQLLPVVTATLTTPEEVAEAIERALADGVALLALDAPVEPHTHYAVDLVAPGAAPMTLLGILAGETVLGYTPMRLSPLGDDQIDELHAFLERHSVGPESGRGPSGRYPAPGRSGEWQGKRRTTASTPPGTPEGEDATPERLVGQVLGGKYRIESVLGGGAMGMVYRARHVALDKPLAIKVLHRRFQQDTQFAERFHREALAASRLDHPNVLRVVDFGDEDGLLYIAMELLTGRDLRTILAEERSLAPVRAIEIMSQICAGLAVAHEAGIVHRDIKPENIVVTSGRDDEGRLVEQVKVCDFGIAAVSGAQGLTSRSGRRLTEEGAICGTPEYMAPEQARGRDVDARADIYACGVMLYEMATGNVPFTGPDFVSVLVAHVTLDPRPPSSIDAAIDRRFEHVILRALAKDPRARYQTAREVRAELRAILESTPSVLPVTRQSRREAATLPPFAAAPERTPPSQPEVARPLSAGPLEDPQAQFPEFFVAFTAAVARTSYYERGHPEFVRAMSRLVATMGPPLAGRGELSFARIDLPTGAIDLQVLTGLGELLDLKRVLPPSIASSHGPRLAEAFARKHLVTLTIKEGIDAGDMADMVELLCGPEIPVEQLKSQFLACGMRHVSALFTGDLLGRERRLPWQVDLCISRLARDLRALPLLRGLDFAGLRRLRTQLIGDVLRMLRGADQVRLLLANADLIAASTRHVAELADLDLATAIIDALPQPLCVRLASLVLDELEADALAGEARKPPVGHGPSARRIVQILGARFVRLRTVESDEVLRLLHDRAVVAFDELPADLQAWVQAEREAGALTRDPDQILRTLDTDSDEAFATALHTAGLAMRVLARRGEAVALYVIVTRLEQLARGGASRSRASLAQKALRAIADPEVLGTIADAFLSGPADVRPSARGILLTAAEAGAQALIEGRGRSAEKVGRGRFVEAMRELGARAQAALLASLRTRDAADPDAALVEDLLRAIAEVQDDALGTEVTRFLQHRVPAVRRAATSAITALWHLRARHALVQALDDVDESVRMVAITGLKKIGAVDPDVVRRLGKVLGMGTTASDELRAVAAAALGAAQLAGREEAVAILARAIEPRSRSVVSMFRGADAESDSTILVETIARSLIAIGGEEGRKAVEKRAGKSGAELRAKLGAILRQ